MSKKTSVRLLALSGLGIILGLSASIAFAFYGNVSACIWAFISAIFAAINFKLHLLHIKDQLEEWHSVETLMSIKLLGVITFLISFGCTTWYTFYVIYKHLPVLPVKDSMALSIIWAFMTAKWGGFLISTTGRYIKILRSTETSLLSAC